MFEPLLAAPVLELPLAAPGLLLAAPELPLAAPPLPAVMPPLASLLGELAEGAAGAGALLSRELGLSCATTLPAVRRTAAVVAMRDCLNFMLFSFAYGERFRSLRLTSFQLLGKTRTYQGTFRELTIV
jgi:hypothetical protein